MLLQTVLNLRSPALKHKSYLFSMDAVNLTLFSLRHRALVPSLPGAIGRSSVISPEGSQYVSERVVGGSYRSYTPGCCHDARDKVVSCNFMHPL